MDVLRTPDERFGSLPGFDLAPRYADVPDGDGGLLRMAYVDAGPSGGPVALLLHGEPSWSFLYRDVIRVLAGAGIRAVAPDLVGFGRSDKPVDIGDHSYARHVEWVRTLAFDALDLRDVTLVGQDWGGLIGLRLATENPDRFARIVVANTGLPTGDRSPTDAFLAWQRFSQETEEFPVGPIVNGGCTTDLSPAVIAAYDAPFPDDTYKAGARIFPTLVPTSPDDPAADANRAAWQVLERWDKPLLTAFSDSDPITRGGARPFEKLVPGAQGRPHATIAGAGHFLQEDKGPELAGVIVDLVEATPHG
jgi:haloalkane dehalogenase